MLVVLVAAVAALGACGNDENLIDAPSQPIDAPTDAGVAVDADLRCSACGPNQVCVAFHDGTCSPNIQVMCQDRNPLCEGINCLQDRDCNFWHCTGGTDAGPYTCYSCPNDIPTAINCHGP
jgi:hypothetical protein